METLYRKVAVSERLPKINGNYFTDKYRSFYFSQEVNKFMDDEGDFIYPKYWLEEIPDNTAVIQQLEAEKAELLEMLYRARMALNKWDDELSYDIFDLIQKHRK